MNKTRHPAVSIKIVEPPEFKLGAVIICLAVMGGVCGLDLQNICCIMKANQGWGNHSYCDTDREQGNRKSIPISVFANVVHVHVHKSKSFIFSQILSWYQRVLMPDIDQYFWSYTGICYVLFPVDTLSSDLQSSNLAVHLDCYYLPEMGGWCPRPPEYTVASL